MEPAGTGCCKAPCDSKTTGQSTVSLIAFEKQQKVNQPLRKARRSGWLIPQYLRQSLVFFGSLSFFTDETRENPPRQTGIYCPSGKSSSAM